MAASYSPQMRSATSQIAEKHGYTMDAKGRLPGEFYAMQVMRMFEISQKKINPGEYLLVATQNLKDTAREGGTGVDMGSPGKGHHVVPYGKPNRFWEAVAFDEQAPRDPRAPSTPGRVERRQRHPEHHYRQDAYDSDLEQSPSPPRSQYIKRSPRATSPRPPGPMVLSKPHSRQPHFQTIPYVNPQQYQRRNPNAYIPAHRRDPQVFLRRLPKWAKPPPVLEHGGAEPSAEDMKKYRSRRELDPKLLEEYVRLRWKLFDRHTEGIFGEKRRWEQILNKMTDAVQELNPFEGNRYLAGEIHQSYRNYPGWEPKVTTGKVVSS